MSEWITPKTNWKNGDYYQYEDALRFANNLTYLKELAQPCYPSSLYFFSYRESYNLNHYFSQWSMGFNTMYIYYPNNLSNSLTSVFSYNLETLFKLSILKRHTGVGLGNKYPLAHTEHRSGSYTPLYINSNELLPERTRYKGWYMTDSFGHTIYTDPLYYEWRQAFYSITQPFTSYRYSSGGISYVGISNRDNLANKQFLTYSNLNTIERLMSELYEYFNTVAESYPDEDGGEEV